MIFTWRKNLFGDDQGYSRKGDCNNNFLVKPGDSELREATFTCKEEINTNHTEYGSYW